MTITATISEAETAAKIAELKAENSRLKTQLIMERSQRTSTSRGPLSPAEIRTRQGREATAEEYQEYAD